MWPFKKSRSPELTADPAGGDPRARLLIDALTARDWRTAKDVLAGVTDPDARAYLMEAAANVSGVQEWIREWIDAEPDSTLPVLVKGCHAVNWAWEARGAKRAEYTQQEQFRDFFHRLRIAENALDEVIDRDPADVTARTWLVTTSRGRQIDADEARARFDAVAARHPFHVVAHEQRLQYLCKKWFGSHEEMFAFAREATAAAPAASLIPELIFIAHIEMWLTLPGGEDAEYIGTEEVAAELHAAAEKSIFHPDLEFTHGWIPRANAFAMGFDLAGESEAAARVFDLLGDNVGGWIWAYRGDAVTQFREARDRAYAHRG
ncbi:hypothetical protein GCM10010435_46860 [Winogradskya consettensis]|uniref:DUF4034 domain-containing protein n=1 Tax=Winogradskya consettensis TaxID=113560 RepID=A0A919SJB2_9ACTN|nr:DUF4034 domain-containing protein [Actinoplanes consettensis]GIM72756.1 hypothetical protein Aco04nite_31790 [Actinoplanes consettensis]